MLNESVFQQVDLKSKLRLKLLLTPTPVNKSVWLINTFATDVVKGGQESEVAGNGPDC